MLYYCFLNCISYDDYSHCCGNAGVLNCLSKFEFYNQKLNFSRNEIKWKKIGNGRNWTWASKLVCPLLTHYVMAIQNTVLLKLTCNIIENLSQAFFFFQYTPARYFIERLICLHLSQFELSRWCPYQDLPLWSFFEFYLKSLSSQHSNPHLSVLGSHV